MNEDDDKTGEEDSVIFQGVMEMDWTNEKLEELFAKMQNKAMIDAGFRKKLLENPDAALEELAGKKLPDGFKVKIIENDPNYAATFVLPDMLSEEMTPEDMDAAAGGYGIMLIVSACAAAVGVTACGGDACAAQGCPGDVACAGQACAARGCAGDVACAARACGGQGCVGNVG